MVWGTLLLARSKRRAASAACVPARKIQVRSAVRDAVETLESRVLMHSGLHLTPTTVAPFNGQQKVAPAMNVTVTFGTDVNTATLNASTFELRDANNNLVPAAITYNAATRTAILDPTGTLATSNNYYYVKAKGGLSGLRDTAGNGLDADLTWSFSTGTAQFTETTVFSGLDGPTALQFAADGRVFVANRSGIINVFPNISTNTPTLVADLRTQVHNFWDRGLLGMALDPQFPTRPYIYVLYTYDGDVGGTSPKFGTANTTSDPGPDATGSGALVSGRLSRLTISGNTLVPGSEKVLISDWQQQFPSHSIGTLSFGPDGALYASAGDGASFNYADYGQTGNPFSDPTNEGGALRAQDLRSTGDATTLDGSIIRIDPDTGLALADNPLYNTGADANAKRIIAEGFRNPFRFTWRPGTNEIWAGDVGWGTWEEINRLPVNNTSVLNYGWPAYEGPEKQAGFDALNLPLLEGLYAEGPNAVVTPYFAYKHTDKVVVGSSEPTGGSSISGVSFYTGNNYPSAYKDALFFSDYSRKAIYVMYKGLDGLPDVSTRQIFKLNNIGPVQLMAGPNGDLYYVDLLNNAIKRFDYASTNRPPTAVITPDKTNGASPLTVNFSGTSSTDPDPADVLSYAWDLNGDGLYDDSTAASPSWTYTTPGAYGVGLKVTDSKGAFNTASVTITAGNSAPVPTISSPNIAAMQWKVGDVISFGGSATDLQEGMLPASSLTWQLILRHESLIDPTSYHEHLIQTYTGVSSGTFIAPDHEYPSKLELRLTATDAGGLSTTTSVVLQPQTSTLNFASNPAGAKISVNGDLKTAPFSQTFIVGSANSVSLTSTQTINNSTYDFVNWSDGGASTHNFIAPAAGSTLSANFTPAGTIPAGWSQSDIGAVGLAGATAYGNGTFTVRGAGADIWGNSDSFRYVYQAITGDSQIVARVLGLDMTDNNAKAGVQFRQSLSADSANVQIDIEGGADWGEFHVRPTPAAATSTTPFLNVGTPHWVKLIRQGNIFTAYRSPDGVSWTLVDQMTVPMSGTIYAGLAVCSHDVATLNTATFDNVTVTGVANVAPTVTGVAVATMAADGKSANLSVIAGDDAGEASLTYAWTMLTGPAAVSVSPNGSNSAKSTVAAFSKAGAYTLRVTVTDAGGKTATNDVSFNVVQALSSVVVTPNIASVAAGQQQFFTAIARDQFLGSMATQPTFAWTIDTGGVGVVSTSGTYTAPSAGNGSAVVRASASGISAAATISVGAVGDVSSGLVHRYKFDESTGIAAADSSGTATGTLTNGVAWTTGKQNAGVSLDGVDDYVATNSDLSTDLGGTASLAAWIKTTQVGSDTFWAAPGLAGVEKHWDSNDIFWGIINGSGHIGVQAGDDTAATSSSVINDGLWHHVAFTRNSASGQLKVYVDGVLQTTATGGLGARTTPFNSIGRIENTAGPAAMFAGSLDEVRVYNRVLSDAEVLAVKTATAGNTNAAPTFSTGAKITMAAPSVGVPTGLSAVGADDGGEANLTYTWSVVTAPTGAAAPAFSANAANGAKTSAVTFTTAGNYVLRVTASDGSLSATSDVSVTVGTFSGAKINFQPSTAPTVSGYTVDAGNLFGVRTSSLAFGWNVSHTDKVYDTNKNANQLLDTVVQMRAGAVWEMAVPNGVYSVKVSVGAPAGAATNTIRVEGTSVFSAAATAANTFLNRTVSVTVIDGRLTVNNGSAADLSTRMNYLEITRTGNAP